VTDSNGESATVTHGVSVVGLPTASFTFAPSTPNIGDAVSFNGSASNDPAGSIKSYAWTFGDGTTGTGATPSHPYTSSGDKTVTLTITANLDNRTASVSKTVHVNVPPHAAFVFAAVINPPNGQDPFTPLIGQQVAFTGQNSNDSDGPALTSYEWDLGTGTFGAPQSVPYLVTTFPTAGSKTVRLRVTDNRGATDVASATFRVDAPPVASFTFAPDAPQTGNTVTFTSTATDPDGAADLRTVSWDFNNDGTWDATGATAQAVFQSAGSYTVKMGVTDSSGAPPVTTTRNVSVAGPPDPGPTTTPPPGDGKPAPVIVSSPGGPIVTPPPFVEPSTAAPVAAASQASPKVLPVLAGVRVQMAGSVVGVQTRITSLLVVAPAGAAVKATCQGAGCPKRALRAKVGRTGRLRLKALERSLRAGGHIVITISKAGFVTRRVELTMRRGKAPRRIEGCLVTGTKGKGTGACPS
jgi:PKD repeat protein